MYRLSMLSNMSMLNTRMLCTLNNGNNNNKKNNVAYKSNANDDISFVKSASSLKEALSLLLENVTIQDTCLMNTIMSKVIEFDVDDASSLAIAQCVINVQEQNVKTHTNNNNSNNYENNLLHEKSHQLHERTKSASRPLILQVMETHKSSLPIRAKCCRCLANMCLINNEMETEVITANNETNTSTAIIKTAIAGAGKVSFVEQLIEQGALELVLGTMQMFHSMKGAMHSHNESSKNNSNINSSYSNNNNNETSIWKQCSWVTLACCNLICLSENGVKRAVRLNGIDILSECLFLLLNNTHVESDVTSFTKEETNEINDEEYIERKVLINKCLDSCMASLAALLTSEVPLEPELHLEKSTWTNCKMPIAEETSMSAVNNYNYQHVSYSTLECIMWLTLYASQQVCGNVYSTQSKLLTRNQSSILSTPKEYVEHSENMSNYLELLHKSWMALQYIASYKPNLPLVFSVLYDVLSLQEINIDTDLMPESKTNNNNNINICSDYVNEHKQSTLHSSEFTVAKSKTHGIWLFNALWQAPWHFIATCHKNCKHGNEHLRNEENVDEQTYELTSSLYYSVLFVLNTLIVPRDEVATKYECNKHSSDNSNDNIKEKMSNSFKMLKENAYYHIHPSLPAHVIYKLIIANDTICHHFALGTIKRIHSNWLQRQEEYKYLSKINAKEEISHTSSSLHVVNVQTPFSLDEYKLLRESLLLLHHLTLNNVHLWSFAKRNQKTPNVNNIDKSKKKNSEKELATNNVVSEDCDSSNNNRAYDEQCSDLVSVSTLIILHRILNEVKWTLNAVHHKYKNAIKQLFRQFTECSTNDKETNIHDDDKALLMQQMTFAGEVYSIVWNLLTVLPQLPYHNNKHKGTFDVKDANFAKSDDDNVRNDLYDVFINDELQIVATIHEIQTTLTNVYINARDDASKSFQEEEQQQQQQSSSSSSTFKELQQEEEYEQLLVTHNNSNKSSKKSNKQQDHESNDNVTWTPNMFEETLCKLVKMGDQLTFALNEIRSTREREDKKL